MPRQHCLCRRKFTRICTPSDHPTRIHYDLDCPFFNQACREISLYDLAVYAQAYDPSSAEFARIKSFVPEKFQQFCNHIETLSQAQLDEYSNKLEIIANKDQLLPISFEQWLARDNVLTAMRDIIREEPLRRAIVQKAEQRRLDVYDTLRSDSFLEKLYNTTNVYIEPIKNEQLPDWLPRAAKSAFGNSMKASQYIIKQVRRDPQYSSPGLFDYVPEYPAIDWKNQQRYVHLAHQRECLKNVHSAIQQYDYSFEKKPNNQPSDHAQKQDFCAQLANCTRQLDTQIKQLEDHANIVIITPKEISELIQLYERNHQKTLKTLGLMVANFAIKTVSLGASIGWGAGNPSASLHLGPKTFTCSLTQAQQKSHDELMRQCCTKQLDLRTQQREYLNKKCYSESLSKIQVIAQNQTSMTHMVTMFHV